MTEEGWVEPTLASEFPELRLHWLAVDARPGKSPPGVKERLRRLSERFRGAQAVEMRRQPVPWAYRVFFRHIGLDPDEDRTPVESIALARLLHGGYRSRNLVDDALTIATIETGVPVWALDAAALEGDLGITTGPDSRLLVADARGMVSFLFGEPLPERAVTPATERIALFSVQVAGVPSIHVEEALWLASEILLEG